MSPRDKKTKDKDKRKGRSRSKEVRRSIRYVPLTEETEDTDGSKLESTLDATLSSTSKSLWDWTSTQSPDEKVGATPKAKVAFGSPISPIRKERRRSPRYVELSPFKDQAIASVKSKSPYKHRITEPSDESSSDMKPLVDNMEAMPIARSRVMSPISLNDVERPTIFDFYKKQSIPEGPEPPDNENTSQSNLSEPTSLTNATQALDIAGSTCKRKQRKHKVLKKSASSRALLDAASSQSSSEEAVASKTSTKHNRRKNKYKLFI